VNQYEIAVLYHPDLEVDLSKAEDRVTKIFTDNKGKVVGKDNWGKRKLAYRINKEDFAVYVLMEVTLPAQSVKKIQSTLNITDEVLRYLLTAIDPKAIEAAKVAAEKAAEAEKEESSSEE